jgi:hypothetical protein
MAVGTDIGKAFVYDRSDLTLPNNISPRLYPQIARTAAVQQARRSTTAQQDRPSVDLSQAWYKHGAELQNGFNQVMELGAKIQSAGQDPYTGVDKASRFFQQAVSQIQQNAAYSSQLREMYEDGVGRITQAANDGNKSKYTPESIERFESFFTNPLSDIVRTGALPPNLEINRPYFELLTHDSGLAKGIMDSRDEAPSDQEIMEIAAQSLQNPDIQAATRQVMDGMMENLDEERMQGLRNIAENQGMDLPTWIRYNQLAPHFDDPSAAYDFSAIEKSMQPGKSSVTRGDGRTTNKWVGLTEENARANTELIVRANPMYVRNGVAQGRFGSPTNSFEENMEAAINWNTERLMSEADRLSSTTMTQQGGRDQELEMARTQWLEDVRSGDFDRMQNAVDHIVGATLQNGTVVESAEVFETTEADGSVSYRIAVNGVKGYMSEADEQTGEKSYEFDRNTLIIDPNQFDSSGLTNDYDPSTFGVWMPRDPGTTDEYLYFFHDAADPKRDNYTPFGQTRNDAVDAFIPGETDTTPKVYEPGIQ